MNVRIESVKNGLIGLGIGIWLGALWIPAEALSVPTETTRSGVTSAIYYPIPSSMIIITGLLIAVIIFLDRKTDRQTTIGEFHNSIAQDTKEN